MYVFNFRTIDVYVNLMLSTLFCTSRIGYFDMICDALYRASSYLPTQTYIVYTIVYTIAYTIVYSIVYTIVSLLFYIIYV